MRWMKLRVQECQTTLVCQRTETSMVSLDGFQTSMLSAPRTTIKDILATENTSMAQWTIMLLSITLQWPTQNSSDKMPQKNPLLEKEFKQWAFKTDLNTAQLWNQLKVPSRHHCMQLLSFLIVIFQINTKWITRTLQLKFKLTPYHSWDAHHPNGSKLLDHQEVDQLIKVRHILKGSIRVELLVSKAEAHKTTPSTWPERDLRKFAEKMDGTRILNQSQSTTSRYMDQWRSHSKEFDMHYVYIHWWYDRIWWNISFVLLYTLIMGLNI